MLYFAMGSMVMLFGGLTSAYVVRHAEGNWLKFDMPLPFYYSTALILLSSIFINWSVSAAKTNNFAGVHKALVITFVLGLAFMVCQFMGWSELTTQKVFFAGKDSNASGSFFYASAVIESTRAIAGGRVLGSVIIKCENSPAHLTTIARLV